MGKIRNCYIYAYKITEYYNLFVDLMINDIKDKDKDKVNKIIDRIKKLILKERKAYKKITVKDIDMIVEELRLIPREEISVGDLRVNGRLAISYDILKDFKITNDDLFPTLEKKMELSIIDIINSKIIIDVYKTIYRKLNELCCDDKKSQEYIKKLNIINMQILVYKLSFYELSEELALNVCYDISKIPEIDIKMVENKIYATTGKTIDLRKLINNKVYKDVLALLDSFGIISLEPDSVDSIYDNLFFVTQIEILLSYLTKEQLGFVSLYCEGLERKNDMVIENIKKLVRNKINVVSEGK